jgi:hypothetical protein
MGIAGIVKRKKAPREAELFSYQLAPSFSEVPVSWRLESGALR